MDKLAFILNELNKIPITDKIVKEKNIVVLCPYHKDTTPSFSISIDPNKRKVPLGYGRCWSCPEKGGWNTFANKINLKSFGIGELSDEYMRKLDENDKRSVLGKESYLQIEDLNNEFKCYLSYPIEDHQEWRGFSGKFLKRFGVYCSSDEYGKDCLLIPVYIYGNICGAVKAFSKKSANKKITSYLNYSGQWIREYGLFPYDYVDKMIYKKKFNYVIICEGIRDALTLIELGYPALCIFGTQTWTDKKLNKIKALGIDTLVIMMDAGKSGIKATNIILEKTEGKNIKRLAVKMQKYQTYYENKKGQLLDSYGKPYEIDPNNCPESLMKKILRWVTKETS